MVRLLLLKILILRNKPFCSKNEHQRESERERKKQTSNGNAINLLLFRFGFKISNSKCKRKELDVRNHAKETKRKRIDHITKQYIVQNYILNKTKSSKKVKI